MDEIVESAMRKDRRRTRRNILKGISGASLAFTGTGIASATKSGQSSKQPKSRIIKEETNKPFLEHIVEDFGTHDEVTLVTYSVGKDGEVLKKDESTIDLKNTKSVSQARNDDSIVENIPNHLRKDAGSTEQGAQQVQTNEDISASAVLTRNTNYSISKTSYAGNLQWKMTLYSTWSYDDSERVLASPYQFTVTHSEGNPYDWNGIQDSEITGRGTEEGHHRAEGKFTGYALSDRPYIEIGFKVRALSAGVDYKNADKL